MEKRRIVITGIGVVTPVGSGKRAFWEAVCHGKNGIHKISSFDATDFTSQIAGEVKDFDPAEFLSAKDIKRTDRFVQFAMVASRYAVKDSNLKLDSVDKNRLGVLIGSGIGGMKTIEREHKILLKKGPSRMSPFFIPMLIVNMASAKVSMDLGLKGPNTCVATACATGTHAIGDAFKIIQRNDADFMLCGGTEAAVAPLGLGGFCAARSLSTRNNEPEKASRPFDKERNGFVMSEGAGVVILEEYEHAKARGAHMYAEIIGYAMSGDAYHMTAPDPEGMGAVSCMKKCLEDAGLKPQQVDYINAHGTSTQLNDKIETKAIKDVFGKHAYKLAVSSTKSMIGHMLGAAGGVECAATALAVDNGILPPTTNYEVPDPECDLDYVPNKARKANINVALSNSLGFGGHNCTIALRKI
ncbi:MAG: beta-ketoacyl-ACP synthase II [Candidatus Omnitrophota bacterium]|nr:MAG: beta-ketoacyl-ACP synthase II [Candidatus Omnitrophota bacterium]